MSGQGLEPVSITIVVTTFNRRELATEAIRSAIEWVDRIGCDILVVDDGSTDGSIEFFEREFASELSSKIVTCERHSENSGVTAAKNTGFEHARGDWVVFLDSDDLLIADATQPVQRSLDEARDNPIVFFRCVDQDDRFVGHRFDETQVLSLARYGRDSSYGEVLVAINKALVKQAPFDADLRGYEGLGCARLIKRFGPALLSPIIARRYRRTGRDRLSAPRGFLARAHLMAIGHRRYVSLLDDALSRGRKLSLEIKAALYAVVGRAYRAMAGRS